MYFVLGMLSIIGAAILATIVWGTLKIVKLLKAIKQHEEWMANNERNVYDNIIRIRDDLDRRMDNMERHAYSHITDLQRELDIRFKDQLDESKSYTDSRFDKAASGLNGAKQLIKG